jgi:hypothetical protein
MEKGLVSALPAENADVRLEWAVARAEYGQRAAALAAAERMAGILETLREAQDARGLYVSAAYRGDDVEEFAARSAVADLAIRLRMSEAAVRNDAARAATLAHDLPSMWASFCEGEISPANATAAADLAATLPESTRRAFDDALLRPARELPPARFRERARRLHEELDPSAERQRIAREGRRVWLEDDRDGMSWLNACLASDDAHRIMARLDSVALHLAGETGETRTLAQLRADAAVDLLLTGEATGVPAVGVSVAVAVPVLTLLGAGELPGTLDGVTPIDPGTARRLAAEAASWQRILTHPVTGTILDIDRRSYRPPADIARWVRHRDGHRCGFAGCGRDARHCDLDHRSAWVDGGRTSAANLHPLCRHHHRLKHEGRWRSDVDERGATVWISPTGYRHGTDPPPF